MDYNKYDVIVIGLGPSSIFLAYELIKLKKYKKVLLIEKGKRVENRNCPLEEIGKCIKCKPFCNFYAEFQKKPFGNMQFDSFPATHGGFVPQMQKKDTLSRVLWTFLGSQAPGV